MKLEILDAADGEFKGRIKGTEFSLEQLFELGYEGIAPAYVEVVGEYHVDSEDLEDCVDQIIGLSAFGAKNGRMRKEPYWVSTNNKHFPTIKVEYRLVPAQYWIDIDPFTVEVV